MFLHAAKRFLKWRPDRPVQSFPGVQNESFLKLAALFNEIKVL